MRGRALPLPRAARMLGRCAPGGARKREAGGVLLTWLGAWAGLGPAGAVPAALAAWLLATLLLLLALRVVAGFWLAPTRAGLIVLLSLALTALLLFAWNLGTALLGAGALRLNVGLDALLLGLAVAAQLWVLRHWLVLPTARAPGVTVLIGVIVLFWALMVVVVSAVGLVLGLPVPRP